MAACSQPPPPTPTAAATPLPAIALRPVGGTVKAAGKVAPVLAANLGVATTGQIISVTVAVGDQVAPGDLLLALDSTLAALAVQQAEATVARAQASLALLMADARPAEIAAAQANLDAARARLAQLQEGVLPATLEAAKAELMAAQAAREQLLHGPTEQVRINARTAVSNSAVALQQAQAAFDLVAWRTDAASLPEGWQLQLTTNNYQAAQAIYATLAAAPSAEQMTAAEARLQQAQANLQKLQTPVSANQVAEAEAMLRSAQAALDLVKAGPRRAAILVARATISETVAVLAQTQANLLLQQLRAPFTGTVVAVNGALGEHVAPAQVLVTLADLRVLQIETTDLSERDVERLQVGQPVRILVEASGEEMMGHVLRIAPQAEVIGGDVVFPVTIGLDEQSSSLRWGMSVQVEIEVD